MRHIDLLTLLLVCSFATLTSCGGMMNKGAIISGQKLYDQGRYEEALRQLAFAAEDNSEAMLLKARSHEARGESDLARNYYASLAERDPDSAEGIVARQKLH